MAKILIVDDDILNANKIKLQLEKREYSCVHVNSGNKCLEIIESEDFDCILLDILMPEVSGIEVLKKIRETKNSFELPIIMVTAKEEASDIVDALKLNANDYLTKPVNIDIASARIQTQINLKSLFKDSLKGKQNQTITTMITTLNHEINNPLAIALGNLTIMAAKDPSERVKKTMNSLYRITDIVKKIEKVVKEQSLEEVQYSDSIKMFDLSNSKN